MNTVVGVTNRQQGGASFGEVLNEQEAIWSYAQTHGLTHLFSIFKISAESILDRDKTNSVVS